MCESSVYLRKDGDDQLIAEDVARVTPDGEQIRVMTLLGEETMVSGEIAEIDLMAHRIVIKERTTSS